MPTYTPEEEAVMRPKVEAFYKEHLPTQLENVDRIMALGLPEEELFQRLQKKYKADIEQTAQLRQRLNAFFDKHAPDDKRLIQPLMERSSDEDTLFARLCKKYNVDPEVEAAERKKAAPSKEASKEPSKAPSKLPSAAPSNKTSKQSTSRVAKTGEPAKTLKEKLVEFFNARQPERCDELVERALRSKMDEEQLFAALERKYGPPQTPKTPKASKPASETRSAVPADRASMASTSSTRSRTVEERERLRVKLREFYTRICGEGDVESKVDYALSLKMGEQMLFPALYRKYNLDADGNPLPSVANTEDGGNDEAAQAEAAERQKKEEERAKLREKVEAFYRRHNPSGMEAKVEYAMMLDVSEEELFRTLYKQYNLDENGEEQKRNGHHDNEAFRLALQEFFERHDPENVPERVEEALAMEEDEEVILQKLHEKYAHANEEEADGAAHAHEAEERKSEAHSEPDEFQDEEDAGAANAWNQQSETRSNRSAAAASPAYQWNAEENNAEEHAAAADEPDHHHHHNAHHDEHLVEESAIPPPLPPAAESVKQSSPPSRAPESARSRKGAPSENGAPSSQVSSRAQPLVEEPISYAEHANAKSNASQSSHGAPSSANGRQQMTPLQIRTDDSVAKEFEQQAVEYRAQRVHSQNASPMQHGGFASSPMSSPMSPQFDGPTVVTQVQRHFPGEFWRAVYKTNEWSVLKVLSAEAEIACDAENRCVAKATCTNEGLHVRFLIKHDDSVDPQEINLAISQHQFDRLFAIYGRYCATTHTVPVICKLPPAFAKVLDENPASAQEQLTFAFHSDLNGFAAAYGGEATVSPFYPLPRRSSGSDERSSVGLYSTGVVDLPSEALRIAFRICLERHGGIRTPHLERAMGALGANPTTAAYVELEDAEPLLRRTSTSAIGKDFGQKSKKSVGCEQIDDESVTSPTRIAQRYAEDAPVAAGAKRSSKAEAPLKQDKNRPRVSTSGNRRGGSLANDGEDSMASYQPGEEFMPYPPFDSSNASTTTTSIAPSTSRAEEESTYTDASSRHRAHKSSGKSGSGVRHQDPKDGQKPDQRRSAKRELSGELQKAPERPVFDEIQTKDAHNREQQMVLLMHAARRLMDESRRKEAAVAQKEALAAKLEEQLMARADALAQLEKRVRDEAAKNESQRKKRSSVPAAEESRSESEQSEAYERSNRNRSHGSALNSSKHHKSGHESEVVSGDKRRSTHNTSNNHGSAERGGYSENPVATRQPSNAHTYCV